MLSLQLVRATFKDHDILFNLAQFYQYDFSEFIPSDLDEEGVFPYLNVRYYLNGDRRAYLARVNGRLTGFVFVDSEMHHRSESGRYIAEFFVLRAYRRRGFGRAMAFQTFDTYKGFWEIAEIGPNVPAQAFWRKVIGEYTHGRYEETSTEEDGLHIVWQTFDSSQW